MRLNEAIESIGLGVAEKLALKAAIYYKLDWNEGLKYVFHAIIKNRELVPKIGGKNDNEETVIKKWVEKYSEGFKNRISKRISRLPGTISDPIIDVIIGQGLYLKAMESQRKEKLEKIKFAHRLSMSAENILGLLLEEYLAERLVKFGYYCAWGETIKKVDFCSAKGDLLQIKNRSNSENSSSSAVREGTTIKKWFRVNAVTGKYCWDELNKQFNTNIFNENEFKDFTIATLKKNPKALAIEPENPWFIESLLIVSECP